MKENDCMPSSYDHLYFLVLLSTAPISNLSTDWFFVQIASKHKHHHHTQVCNERNPKRCTQSGLIYMEILSGDPAGLVLSHVHISSLRPSVCNNGQFTRSLVYNGFTYIQR